MSIDIKSCWLDMAKRGGRRKEGVWRGGRRMSNFFIFIYFWNNFIICTFILFDLFFVAEFNGDSELVIELSRFERFLQDRIQFFFLFFSDCLFCFILFFRFHLILPSNHRNNNNNQ